MVEMVIEKEPEDEGYLAYSLTLPGCFSNGKTIHEARRNMRQAIEEYLASLLAHGQLDSAVQSAVGFGSREDS